jgi:hypothetical protein
MLSSMRQLPRVLYVLLCLALCAVALVPLGDRLLARRHAAEAVRAAREHLGSSRDGDGLRHVACQPCAEELLRLRTTAATLASWGNVGGCGVGGGASSSTAGGAKWIGRGVTGGRFDLQCLTSESFMPLRGYFTGVNTRIATGRLFEKWVLGVNVPILYKRRDVEVLGVQKTATIPGFGDIGLEVTRKLGITNSSLVTLMLSAPTGAYDAQRAGIVLPQQLQLGSGVLGATGLFEHTFDRDWGLIVAGGTFTYGGWTNGIGDYRAPSFAGYTYLGYTLGPFVPSAGVTLLAKVGHDRERQRDLDDALFISMFSLAVEWSIDWLAVLLSGTLPVSYHGVEGGTITLGVSTSVF